MRRVWAVVVACLLALAAAACNPLERMYFREGIGTELYSRDILPATELQNIYLDHLCRQSLPFVGPYVPSCEQQELPPNAWPLIVQAGMNDIDARCDSYLAWLDQRKRENAAILAEISAIRIAVDALTNPAVASGISPATLAAVAAAFGLANNTLANINSLLLSVDHTTVQSVVFINRRDFRENIRGLIINNKPMTIHALRSYLEICMPMTISANINSTVTVFQQTGSGILSKSPLVSTKTIGQPARAGDPAGRDPGRPPIPRFPGADQIIVNYTPNEYPPSVVRRLQEVLCVPAQEVGKVGETTRHHIAIFEASDMFEASDNPFIVRDGKIDLNERDVLQKSSRCPRSNVRNFYERVVFADGRASNLTERVNTLVINRLNKMKLPNVPDLAQDTPLDSTRTRIKLVREELMKNPDPRKRPRPLPDSMAGQWTIDLFNILTSMQ